MARSRRKRRDVALYCDILGVLLLFISATMFVSLLTSDSGIFGHAMAAFLRMVAGVGAYVLPLAVAAIGVIFLIGPFLPASRNAAVGAALIFFVVVAWQHLGVAPPVSAVDEFFSPETLSMGGGYAGALLSYALKRYFGLPGAYAALVALGVMAIILITGKPVAEMLRRAHILGRDTFDTARTRFPKKERKPERPTPSEPKPDRPRSILFARNDK